MIVQFMFPVCIGSNVILLKTDLERTYSNTLEVHDQIDTHSLCITQPLLLIPPSSIVLLAMRIRIPTLRLPYWPTNLLS